MSALAPEIPAVESRNWLLHRHYTRHEYSACKLLIEQELTKSDGHEYASYLKVTCTSERDETSLFNSAFHILFQRFVSILFIRQMDAESISRYFIAYSSL